jgi:hypothetical protein
MALFLDFLKNHLLKYILKNDERGYNRGNAVPKKKNSKKIQKQSSESSTSSLHLQTWDIRQILKFHDEVTRVLGVPELWPEELDFISEAQYIQICPGKQSGKTGPKVKTSVNQRNAQKKQKGSLSKKK